MRAGRLDTVSYIFFYISKSKQSLLCVFLLRYPSYNEIINVCIIFSQWQTLQQAKHGKVHLRLSWHRLSSDLLDLSHVSTHAILILLHPSCYLEVVVKLSLSENGAYGEPKVKIDFKIITVEYRVQIRQIKTCHIFFVDT